MSNYWKICIEDGLCEVGISATEEQILELSEFVERAHENYDLYTGADCIPNPLELENQKLTKMLEEEREKVHCHKCNGRGRIYSQGPYHGGDSECWKCRGEGKVSIRDL